MNKANTTALIGALAVTMIAEGMITVSLLWSGAQAKQSPLLLGVVLFVMNIVPFLAQRAIKPFARIIADRPLRTLVYIRLLGVPIAGAAFVFLPSGSGVILVTAAAGLAFVTFITQQCLETYMGHLTVAGKLDSGSAARLSQAALQVGVFIGNALAGFVIASIGSSYVFAVIAALLLVSVTLTQFKDEQDGNENKELLKQDDVHKTNSAVWLLIFGMGVLAIQLTGFNYFMPLIYEGQLHLTAADYGLVSASAGVGALLASTIKISRTGVIIIAILIVAVADCIIGYSSVLAGSMALGFVIGFGFNLARIRVRQLIFQTLQSKAEAALWGGRITVTFRSVAALAPLAFGLTVSAVQSIPLQALFATVGILIMGLLVPGIMLIADRMLAPGTAEVLYKT